MFRRDEPTCKFGRKSSRCRSSLGTCCVQDCYARNGYGTISDHVEGKTDPDGILLTPQSKTIDDISKRIRLEDSSAAMTVIPGVHRRLTEGVKRDA